MASVKIRIRNGIIHLIIYNAGIRKEVSTELHVSPVKSANAEIMKLAEIIRAKKEAELVANANGIFLGTDRTVLYDWCSKCAEANGKKEYKLLPWLEKYGGKEVLLTGVTPDWIEKFQHHMEKDSGLAAWTAERYMCILRGHLKKAVRDSYIVKNPAAGIAHVKTPGSHKDPLSAEELKAMVATPWPENMRVSKDLARDIRNGFIFSCLTGLRVSDILQLTWGDIDIDRMSIAKRQQKTQEMVYIPIDAQAWSLINDGVTHDTNEHVFPALASSGTDTNIYLKRWGAAAGVKKNVTWHTARHTDATLLIEYGADLYTVQKLLGHAKIETTAQYAALSDKKKRAAVDALPDLGLGKN